MTCFISKQKMISGTSDTFMTELKKLQISQIVDVFFVFLLISFDVMRNYFALKNHLISVRFWNTNE